MAVVEKHHELYNQLASIVGSKYVSDDLAVRIAYTRDISVVPPGRLQGAVVRPGSVGEVVEIVRVANQTRTPLIPMGGKASACGVPPGQPGRGIIVDMRRMDKVIDVDEANMAVTAQAGITLGELAGKLNEKGFDFHTAFQPHYLDTLGGQYSGVPGGGFGEYGFSVGYNQNYILGTKVVLPTGRVVDTGTGEGSLNSYRGHTWARGMGGPDIGGIFIGDGGMFGIKVEATVRMFRLPKFQKSTCRCWENLDEAYQAYYELWGIDPILYMQPYSMGWLLGPDTIKFATMGEAKPLWTFILKFVANSEEELEFKFRTTDEFLAKRGGKVGEPAALTFANTFLEFIRNIGRASSSGQLPLFELIVSRRDHLECYKWARAFLFDGLKRKGIDPETQLGLVLDSILSAGVGFGMISLIPTFDPSDLELHSKIHEIFEEFMEEAYRRGYVLEASQGHESLLKAKQWTGEYYNFILDLKKMLDPNNIMNPGVFFP